MFTSADAYERFMGRYSRLLAKEFADYASITDQHRVIDVGGGTGALTTELSMRLGESAVSAIDPSEPFVEAARERHPLADVRVAAAEAIPFDDGVFDSSLAQLVVHFMKDPVIGIREMMRVTRFGGTVAACVWDLGGGQGPLGGFWAAAREFDPGVDDESNLAGVREGHLGELFLEAGVEDVESGALSIAAQHSSFEEWWEPFTLGVGPAGAYVSGLSAEERVALREVCRRRLPEAPFSIQATAWAARGRVGRG